MIESDDLSRKHGFLNDVSDFTSNAENENGYQSSSEKNQSLRKDESEEELHMNKMPQIAAKFESRLNELNRKSQKSPRSQQDKLEVKSTLSNTSHFTSNSTQLKNAGPEDGSFNDVALIIEKIRDPSELSKAFQSYVARSKDIDIEELRKSDKSKIKRYKDCVYFGEFINSKRHGKGIMIYSTLRVYEGDWENDIKHGKGLEICPNGSRYEGQFVNGKPEGVGTFLWSNGEVYEGEWKNGLKHGSGMWRGTKGDSYIGEWKSGKADGYGVHTWRNGDRYEGEFKAFLKHGHGTEKFVNGDFYVGNYVNGKPDGYGEYYWANGCQYKGFFKNGLRHGKGVWKKGNGKSDFYDGEWVNDKKCGYGVYKWVSGNHYQGHYFDDMRHGYGDMFWTDGSYYKGMWERGIQHGEGELVIPGKKPKRGLFQNNIYIGDSDDRENLGLEAPENDTTDNNIKTNIVSRGMTSPKENSMIKSVNNKNTEMAYYSESGTDGKQMLPEIRSRSSKRASNRATPIRERPQGTSVSSDKGRTVKQSLLSKREMVQWNNQKDKFGPEAHKLRDFSNPEVCDKIRNLLNPPVWRYWGKNKLESRLNGDTSPERSGSNNYFPAIK